MRDSLKLAAILAFFASIQLLLIITHDAKIVESSIDDDSYWMPQLDAATAKNCFPPRHGSQHHDADDATIIYLETAYVNLHYETYYSFIHEICSCDEEKDPYWTISNDTLPHFYVGPAEMTTVSFEKILQEFGTTTCGPIFIGTPTKPHLTIVTTSYPDNFDPGHELQYHKLINDERYIFICHEDGPSLESAKNVFFLTPRHERFIVPSFFPPTIVRRHSKSIRQQHPEKPPIFLVLGSFNNRYRRNVHSLAYPLEAYRDKKFVVRFLGGASTAAPNEVLAQLLRDEFPKDQDKIEFLPRADTYEFMVRVAEADVVVPLVEAGSFLHEKGYQGGKKLTSSVMWGLGFRKKMILYRPLAEVFGIHEDNATYFLHGDSTRTLQAFYEAFGRCLEHLLENP